ncbi:MAG: hypothetical protein ACR2OF_07440 [Hyphomicrobium sp.]
MQLFVAVGSAALRSVLVTVLFAASIPAAQANWFSKVARDAGEAGAKSAKYGVAGLDRAAAHIKALPPTAKGATLAAHATPEGHWKFVNRDGEVFTAGTPDELERAVPTLLPEKASDTKLTIYLTEDTVFGERALLKALPDNATLHVMVGRDSFPLVHRAGPAGDKLFAEVRPNLIVELADQKLFNEAIAQLERPLSRSSIRTVSREPGGPQTLSSAPRMEPGTKNALVDSIDPANLDDALRSVRGQTVLMTGRIEDNLLYFRPESGPEQSFKVLDLIRAAENADVNLVILHSQAPRQPGGRNWLWQRISVDGLDAAMKRATLGDFLDGLAANRGQFNISVAREGSGRVIVRATPAGSAAQPITGVVGEWLSVATSQITGNVIVDVVDVHARDEARQRELDRRIIPWIPWNYQLAYIAGLLAGVLGWAIVRDWWRRIWPPEQREEYRGVAGYRAAQTARFLAFLLVFLPLAGVPALFVSMLQYVWRILMLPLRFFRRHTSRAEPKAG